MKLIFAHGPAACGKLTIAKEVAASTGLRLFHNHLTVDLVGSLFEFGSEGFVRLRESIWIESFQQAAQHGQSLTFTFHPEATVQKGFPERVVSTVEALGGEVLFVELTCPDEEIENRVENASRGEYGKLRSLEDYRRLKAAGAFEYPRLPAAVIRLDTSAMQPREAAEQIVAQINSGD